VVVLAATGAARYGVPAMYTVREFADAGGLISYGTNCGHWAKIYYQQSRHSRQ